MTANCRRSAAAAPFWPAPSPTPPSRSAAPPPNSPAPPRGAVHRLCRAEKRSEFRRHRLMQIWRNALRCSALLLLLGAGLAKAAEAPGHYQGTLEGANYLVNVPPDWNGGLVMFAHGY